MLDEMQFRQLCDPLEYNRQRMLLMQQNKKRIACAAARQHHTPENTEEPEAEKQNPTCLKETVALQSNQGVEDAKNIPAQVSFPSCPQPHLSVPVVRQHNNIFWVAFPYETHGLQMEYTIRSDTNSVDTTALSDQFKWDNSIINLQQSDLDEQAQDTQRAEREALLNWGWALAELNPCLRDKRDLLVAAVVACARGQVLRWPSEHVVNALLQCRK